MHLISQAHTKNWAKKAIQHPVLANTESSAPKVELKRKEKKRVYNSLTQSETNTTQEGSRQGLVSASFLVKEGCFYTCACIHLIHSAQHTRLPELL